MPHTPIHEYENRIVGTTEENNPELEAAIALLARRDAPSGRASRQLETFPTDQDARNDQQEQDIEDLARARGIWINDTCLDLKAKYGSPIARGAESTVYAMDGRTVIKAKNTLQYHDLQEALWAIKFHNQLSPESALTVTGFGRNSDGDFCIIITQPYIRISQCLTRADIDTFVTEVYPSFIADDQVPLPGRFRCGAIHLNDLHPGNVLCDLHGDIIIIDSIVRLSDYNSILQHQQRCVMLE